MFLPVKYTFSVHDNPSRTEELVEIEFCYTTLGGKEGVFPWKSAPEMIAFTWLSDEKRNYSIRQQATKSYLISLI